MALSVAANLTNATYSGAATAAITTSSISPTANSLLQVAILQWKTSADPGEPVVTDSFSGTGAWTVGASRTIAQTNMRVSIATAKAGATPGSGTITVTPPVTFTRAIVIVDYVTGQDVTTPVPQVKTNSIASGVASTLTVTLDSTPAASSLVYGAVGENFVTTDTNIAPGSGFTELLEVTLGAFQLQTQYDLVSADTTCDWTNLGNNGSAAGSAAVVIEVAEASSGAQTISPNAIASTATVYQPTVTFGAITVSPDAIASVAVVYQPTLTFGAITVALNAIAGAAQVYQPTVSVGAIIVSPNAIASSAVVYEPTVIIGLITVTLQPDETTAIDTFVQEAAPTNVGTTVAVFSVNGTAGSRRHMLFKFDLSVLAGQTIISATLYLHNTSTSVSSFSFPIHAILAANSAWIEGATWDYAVPSTVRWAGDTGANGGTDAGASVSGTDYNAAAIGTLDYLANIPADTEIAASLDVTQLAAMVAANYGLLMRRATGSTFTFHSSSATTAGFRPRLVVLHTAMIAPNAIASAAIIYEPTLIPGAITVSPNAIASSAQVFAPTLTFGVITISLNIVDSTVLVFEPTVSAGGVISPDFIAGTAQVFAPTLTFGAISVALDAIASSAVVYEPTVSIGALTIAPNVIAGTAVIYQPSLSFGPIAIVVAFIASTATVYNPIVSDDSAVEAKLDVVISDSALYAVALSNSTLHTVALFNSALYNVTLTDSTR